MSIDIWTISPLIAVAMVALLVYLRRSRGKSYGYLACVALFGSYLAFVAHWTIFPLPLDSAVIAALSRERSLAAALQLIPLEGGLAPTRYELIGNLLLGVPFGFGLPFISPLRGLRVLAAGLAFAFSIELVQLVIDVAYGFGHRVVDIDDVILVWLGVVAGYIAFGVVAALYRSATQADDADQGTGGHVHDVLTQ